MVVCTAFHTHSIESTAQSMRRVVFAPFYDEILAQSLSPSSSTTVSGREAERGVRPETFLPPGLCFVPSAEGAARGPHPPEKGRCPPLRSVAPRCPTLCLISQMPSPSVTAVSSSRWALTPCLGQDSADLDCPQLLWVLAKSNAQCLWGLFLCCWEAGQGRRAAGLPAGGAPRVPIPK